MRKIAIIDSDSIVYILAWKFKDLREGYENLMEKEVDQFMIDIIVSTGATHYIGAFTPKRNFRYEIAVTKGYKANRPPSPDWILYWKPKILELCERKYGFIIGENIEADDILSILHKGVYETDEVILCSPDKDMKQLPGKHYNYSKQTLTEITPEEAVINFWTQVLVGDTTDNIPGAYGIGPKKAAKILAVPADQYQKVVEATFQQVYAEGWEQFYQESVSLIRLVEPTAENVEYYGSKIQAVQVSDSNEVQAILNDSNGTNEGVLRDSERPHEGDILCTPFDIS